MPQAHVTFIGADVSTEKREHISRAITDLMVSVLNRRSETVLVSFRVTPASDWAVGGKMVNGAGLCGVQIVLQLLTGVHSDAEKAEMIARATTALNEIVGKVEMPFYILIEEVPTSQWGFNGQTVAQIYARRAAAAS